MSEEKQRHPSWFKMKLERRELVRQLSEAEYAAIRADALRTAEELRREVEGEQPDT